LEKVWFRIHVPLVSAVGQIIVTCLRRHALVSLAFSVVAERIERVTGGDSQVLACSSAGHILEVDIEVAFCTIFHVLGPECWCHIHVPLVGAAVHRIVTCRRRHALMSLAFGIVAERVERVTGGDSQVLACSLAGHILEVDIVVAFCTIFHVLGPKRVSDMGMVENTQIARAAHRVLVATRILFREWRLWERWQRKDLVRMPLARARSLWWDGKARIHAAWRRLRNFIRVNDAKYALFGQGC